MAEKQRGNKKRGRKSKAEEQQYEKLSPLEPWHLRHYRSLRSGQDWAVKLFFQYNSVCLNR
jgi:hypothetical protein